MATAPRIERGVEEYIAGFDPEIQARLRRMREAFFELLPDATEGIKYRMPTILHHGNLLHYAAFKSHIGLYPLPHALEVLKDETSGFKQGKGSIQFPNDRPLPMELIVKIAKARIAEREEEPRREEKPTR